MTNRIQTLRSNVPGNRPTGRLPGELYVNWPDMQLGVINSTNNPQDLIAVRFFSSTSNYNVGDYVVQGGSLYSAKTAITAGAFNATQWAQVGGAVTVSDTAPLLPGNGQLWYDSVGGQLYVYYTDPNTSQWVIAVSPPVSALVSIGDTPPPTPTAGQFWFDSVGQQLYVWYNDGNSSQWVPSTNQFGGGYLPLSGGTLTGPLNAPQGVIAPQVIGDNRIINGDCRIDQRNNGAVGSANGYTIDRWTYNSSQAGKLTWGRRGANAYFPYALGFQSASAYALVAGDYFYVQQPIEADQICDFAWGISNAQQVTLSFWAFSSLTGSFGGCIQNYAATRAYPFTYSLPAANTWYKIIITIPGDTTGTWVMSGNAGSMYVTFGLGVGSTYTAPAGAWTSGNYVSANGAVSLVAANGATFYITGVKLEIGSVATPYGRQSLAKSLMDCQRYYIDLPGRFFQINTPGAATYFMSSVSLPTVMRATPTGNLINVNSNNGTLSLYQTSVNNYTLQATSTSPQFVFGNYEITLSAEL